MYYTKGIKEVIRRINLAIGISTPIYELTHRELASAYHKFLYQRSIFESLITWESIKLTDYMGLKKFAPSFCSKKKIFFTTNSSLLKNRLASHFFTEALNQLDKQCPELYELVQFVIKIILINQLSSYTNGTTDSTIGLGTLDFKDHFNEHDFLELIIHQMTHMLLFIDDHQDPHMLNINKDIMIETGLKYKLGGTLFPAYVVFHSYIIGIEILHFREQITGLSFEGNYHGCTQKIIRSCDIFQKSLIDKISLFSPNGQTLLEESICLLDKIRGRFQK